MSAQFTEAVDQLLRAFQPFTSAHAVDFTSGYVTRLPPQDVVEVLFAIFASRSDVENATRLRRLHREFQHTLPLGRPVTPLPSSEKSLLRRSVEKAAGRMVEFLQEVKQREAKPKPKRRRASDKPRKPRPPTQRQLEAIQIVGECRGNVAEAARRLGKDRKTVEEAYRTGMAKAGKEVFWQNKKTKTRLLIRDKRGQETVSTDAERF